MTLISIISDNAFAVETLINFGGKREIEVGQLVQGSLAYDEDGVATIYPRFVVDLPQDLDPSAEPLTAITGRVSFKFSKEVGSKGGVTFNISLPMKNAPKGYLSIGCIAFDKTPKMIKQYADGKNITVFGKLSPKSYVNKEGVEVLSWSMLVQNFQFIGGSDNQAVETEKAAPHANDAAPSYSTEVPF